MLQDIKCLAELIYLEAFFVFPTYNIAKRGELSNVLKKKVVRQSHRGSSCPFGGSSATTCANCT